MLIGYSVDTDILLTTRVSETGVKYPKTKEQLTQWDWFTMAAAAIGSMVALYLVVYFFYLMQRFWINCIILIIGLVADVLATWLMNLGILNWYMEGKRWTSKIFSRTNESTSYSSVDSEYWSYICLRNSRGSGFEGRSTIQIHLDQPVDTDTMSKVTNVLDKRLNTFGVSVSKGTCQWKSRCYSWKLPMWPLWSSGQVVDTR